MALSRLKAKRRQTTGQFLLLPHQVLKHSDFISLSPRATRLLIDLGLQFNGHNNGDLCAAMSLMKKRGWTSNDQLNKAKKELIEKKLILLTRQGGKKRANLYAITWQPIDDCKGKLDVTSTTLAPRSFKN